MDTVIGAVVIIFKEFPNKETKYLLLQHKNTYWTFVGGRIEETDKTIEEGLNREIKEELGLLPSDYILLDTKIANEFIYGNEKPDRAGKKGITYYYTGQLVSVKEPVCQAEIIQMGWFTKEEILEHLAFEDIKSKFLEVINKTSI